MQDTPSTAALDMEALLKQMQNNAAAGAATGQMCDDIYGDDGDDDYDEDDFENENGSCTHAGVGGRLPQGFMAPAMGAWQQQHHQRQQQQQSSSMMFNVATAATATSVPSASTAMPPASYYTPSTLSPLSLPLATLSSPVSFSSNLGGGATSHVGPLVDLAMRDAAASKGSAAMGASYKTYGQEVTHRTGECLNYYYITRFFVCTFKPFNKLPIL